MSDESIVVVALLLGACALAHFSVAPAHFREWIGFGVLFVIASMGQLWLAVAVFRRPSERVMLASQVVCAGVILVWLVSRTVGLPFGPDVGVPESAGALDFLTSGAELVVIALLRNDQLRTLRYAGAIVGACLLLLVVGGLGHS